MALAGIASLGRFRQSHPECYGRVASAQVVEKSYRSLKGRVLHVPLCARELSNIEQRVGTLKGKVVPITVLFHRHHDPVTESVALPPPLREAFCKNLISCLTT
jgi:hypothetical protein